MKLIFKTVFKNEPSRAWKIRVFAISNAWESEKWETQAPKFSTEELLYILAEEYLSTNFKYQLPK